MPSELPDPPAGVPPERPGGTRPGAAAKPRRPRLPSRGAPGLANFAGVALMLKILAALLLLVGLLLAAFPPRSGVRFAAAGGVLAVGLSAFVLSRAFGNFRRWAYYPALLLFVPFAFLFGLFHLVSHPAAFLLHNPFLYSLRMLFDRNVRERYRTAGESFDHMRENPQGLAARAYRDRL